MVKRGRKTCAKKRMSKSDQKFHEALCVLKSMTSADRCQAIAQANGQFIRKVSTTLRKLRSRKVTAKQKKRLQAYRKQLRQVANPKTSLKSKRKVLSQKGGFLPALLPLLAPVIGPLVGSILGGNRD